MTDQSRKALREELVTVQQEVQKIKGLTPIDVRDKVLSFLEGRLEIIDKPHCWREEVND